jgi:hypothetical protein
MTDVTGSWWHPAMVPAAWYPRQLGIRRQREIRRGGTLMLVTNLPAEMRASDADRDAALSDLSEHFQAGRLTAGEFDERTGRALAARTMGELRDLLADLPAARPVAAMSSGTRAWPSSERLTPRLILTLAGVGIVAAVLVGAAHGGWGLIWLLVPVLAIARRFSYSPGTADNA